MPRAKPSARAERGEVLVAILRDKSDFAILQEQLWYRIPVERAPKRWPPRWLAFYHTKAFGEMAYAVHCYGRVRQVDVVRRRDLFPHEPLNPKSDREYYRVRLDRLDRLERPIRSGRPRRIVFIPTTWHKFTTAAEINDLFHESPLEDRLWAQFRQLNISAERQWDLKLNESRYVLDFAVFCAQGQIDVETDGDTWHARRDRIPKDNRRDNALALAGWGVLRFNGKQIRESLTDYCVPKILGLINRLGGLGDEGMVPRKFFNLPGGPGQQLSLFDEAPGEED